VTKNVAVNPANKMAPALLYRVMEESKTYEEREMEAGIFAGIVKAFSEGGIWMWAIFAVQIVSIAIIAERVMTLFVLKKTGQKQIAQALESDIRLGRLDLALTKARTVSGTPMGAVAQAGIQASIDLGGREEIQAKMDEVLLDERSVLEKRTGFLAMLGNVGTLLGLLGTIVGLIEAFSSVSNLDAAQRTNMLTQGVALAMNATAYGLIMAIPSLVLYAILQNRANHLMEDLNQGSLKVYNALNFSQEHIKQAQTPVATTTTRTRRTTGS
jgi:biopolymer transport protein ExbB